MRSNKVIWIADACHAGTLGSQTIAMRSGQANITNRLLREMAQARNGLALFMATSANQTSQEAEKWGGGVFTHFLLKGLQGGADSNGNKFVSLSELAEYVQHAVADATKGEQRPEVSGNFDQSLEVAVVRK
jgi:uncharacterized caspase-like protein